MKLYFALHAPPVGIEPTTNCLTGNCSTAELQRNTLYSNKLTDPLQ